MTAGSAKSKLHLRLRVIWWRRRSRLIGKRRWAEAVLKGDDGLTQFQHIAARALERAFGACQWQTAKGSEQFLRGFLPITGTIIYLYEDGAQLQHGDTEACFERWDFKSPRGLLMRLMQLADSIEKKQKG